MRQLLNKIFWGVWLIYLAIMFILACLGVLGGFPAWRLAITMLMLKVIADNICSRQFFLLVMPLAIILCLFGFDWHMGRLDPWGFLIPGILISLALNILFGAKKLDKRIGYGTLMHKSQAIDAENGFIRITANGNGIIKYVNSQNLKNVDIHTSFGSLKAFFDGSHIPTGEALIKIDSKCSSVELYVPKTWNVIDKLGGNAVGGMDIKGIPEPDGSATVTVEGTYSFGNVQLIYV